MPHAQKPAHFVAPQVARVPVFESPKSAMASPPRPFPHKKTNPRQVVSRRPTSARSVTKLTKRSTTRSESLCGTSSEMNAEPCEKKNQEFFYRDGRNGLCVFGSRKTAACVSWRGSRTYESSPPAYAAHHPSHPNNIAIGREPALRAGTRFACCLQSNITPWCPIQPRRNSVRRLPFARGSPPYARAWLARLSQAGAIGFLPFRARRWISFASRCA